MIKKMIFLGGITILSSCASAPRTDERLSLVAPTPNVSYAIGYPDAALTDNQARMQSAQKMALERARKELMFQVQSLMMSNGKSVEKKMRKDARFAAMINDAVNNARIDRTVWDQNGSCSVTIRIPRETMEQWSIRFPQ
jgi:hypothetical protein